jgi:ferritin
VLLPIIMVGQNVIQSQNEAKADVDHKTLTYLATLQDEQMQELKNQTEILRRLEALLETRSQLPPN